MATETKKKRASIALDVRVPTDIAWRGVTDTRELQIWFAQQVNSDLEKESFQFGGKYVPFLRYDERPTQKVLEYNPEEMLFSFEWPLRKRDGEITNTIVKFRISPMNEFSRLDVDHIVDADDLTDDDLRNLWTILLNGFVFHMEGASGWIRPEFTHKRSKELHLELWTSAKRDAVFEAWTTIEGIKSFFAPKVKEVKPEPEGVLDLGWDKLPIREVEENSLISFGWREVEGEDPNLTVTIELKDEGNGTRLILIEGTFEEPIVLSNRPDFDGWAAVLNDLKRYLETHRHPVFLSILIEPFQGKAK